MPNLTIRANSAVGIFQSDNAISVTRGSLAFTGKNITLTDSGSPSGIVLFDPGDLGAYATHDEIFTVDTNDHDGGISSLQSAVTRPGGSSKAIRIQYPNDEAGTQLVIPTFDPTPSLYIRFWMFLDANWAGNYPAGLKTARCFTSDTWTTPAESLAYHSPKMVWTKYLSGEGFAPDGPGEANPATVWGCCSAIHNLDVGAEYSSPIDFAGEWRLIEIYQVINSGDGVEDGVLEMRVDTNVVYNNTTTAWVDSGRGVGTGLQGWQSLWFGGNFSGGDRGFTYSGTLNRYEDGHFASTDARWVT
jgi:hypothetical protein